MKLTKRSLLRLSNRIADAFMGVCYSVVARIGVKDQRRASRALRQYIREHDGVNCDFALDDYRAEGVSTHTFDGLMRIVFAGWKGSEYESAGNRTLRFTRTPFTLLTAGNR